MIDPTLLSVVLGVVALVVVVVVIFAIDRATTVPPPVEPASSGADANRATIEALIRGDRKIEAIKLYREKYGVSLKEAKDAVDAIHAGRPLPAPSVPPPAAAAPPAAGMAEVERLARQRLKLQAIKAYRELTGAGLKEAKDAVERLPGGPA